LRYQPDFIAADKEAELIGHIRALPLAPFQFGAFEGKRRVFSYGSRYDYTAQRIAPADPLPEWITAIAERVEVFAKLPAGAVAQVLCTEYEPGTAIGWHRDKPHYDQVFGLSLASACKFRLRRKSGAHWERYSFDAQPRSLYVMTSASRKVWEHSIPPVEVLRYSITFRTIMA
jgi:alkylated DNA repair dioxygenase AlkB